MEAHDTEEFVLYIRLRAHSQLVSRLNPLLVLVFSFTDSTKYGIWQPILAFL